MSEEMNTNVLGRILKCDLADTPRFCLDQQDGADKISGLTSLSEAKMSPRKFSVGAFDDVSPLFQS